MKTRKFTPAINRLIICSIVTFFLSAGIFAQSDSAESTSQLSSSTLMEKYANHADQSGNYNFHSTFAGSNANYLFSAVEVDDSIQSPTLDQQAKVEPGDSSTETWLINAGYIKSDRPTSWDKVKRIFQARNTGKGLASE